ncbi:hypothetical protein AOLI_G00251070 [Acnodon oligacanthus]
MTCPVTDKAVCQTLECLASPSTTVNGTRDEDNDDDDMLQWIAAARDPYRDPSQRGPGAVLRRASARLPQLTDAPGLCGFHSRCVSTRALWF